MSTPTIGMQIASGPQTLNCGLVIALNIVDMDNYVSKEELKKMHVMTWGNELPEEE